MTNVLSHTSLLAVAIALAACAGGDAPAADSAAADGVTSTIAPSTAGTPVDSAAMAAPTGASSATAGMLDPNAATKEQLAAVPGMTPAAADALIAGRPYADMVAVDKALAGAGLGADARKQVYARVFKLIDPNTATRAEMKLIPGVGDRMAHEFEEYRPWKSTAQFDREIGKYADKAEVARLKTYLALPQ